MNMNKNEAVAEKLIDAETRAKLAGRVEVLDKVKEMFLLPKLDMMTAQQVADYYEVGIKAIQSCYYDNRNEIREDGVVKYTPKMLKNLNLLKGETEKARYVTEIKLSDDIILRVPNAGINLFSKRAILRIGMLLRDSKIAHEVRTQLLNTFEHSTGEQRTQEILTEQELYINLGQAFLNGSKEDLLIAGKDIIDYQNRHIRSLEKSNKVLAAEILEWTDRASLNKAVRYVAAVSRNGFSEIWKELYQELLYKHSINLKRRGGSPYIQHIREFEWGKVQQSLAAICEKYEVDINSVVEVSKMQEKTA